ncbi:hypothetical protein QJQ45_026451 [Haematococcus lacustris]|nr:hypothetical protein QJQ45_026451 [Haematococcus lacustris]
MHQQGSMPQWPSAAFTQQQMLAAQAYHMQLNSHHWPSYQPQPYAQPYASYPMMGNVNYPACVVVMCTGAYMQGSMDAAAYGNPAAMHYRHPEPPPMPGSLGPNGPAMYGMELPPPLQPPMPQPTQPLPASTHQASQGQDPDDDEDGGGSARALKRPRLVWTSQLHRRFEEAINKLGDQRAVPKNIMQEMKVEGLTRENVASHLQKWRLQNRRDEPRSGGTAANDAGPTGADS